MKHAFQPCGGEMRPALRAFGTVRSASRPNAPISSGASVRDRAFGQITTGPERQRSFIILDSAHTPAIISLKPNLCVCEQVTNGVSFPRLGRIRRELLRCRCTD